MYKLIIYFCLLLSSILFYSFMGKSNHVESKKYKLISVNDSATITMFDKIKDGSVINWTAAHLGGINPRIGRLFIEAASVSVNNNLVTTASLTINMNKLTVDNMAKDEAKDLKEHLKSDDFFNINEFPFSQFELTKLMKIEGDYNSEVTGHLTILGVTNSITFYADINVSKNEVSIKSEKFIINRTEWGMTYNEKGTFGVPLDYLISNDIGLEIDAVFIK